VFGADTRFNSLGMRDLEHGPKRPGTRRVLVLGDSNVVGLGVAADDIFPRRLETLLNAGGRSVEVVAAAVVGWNTVAERNFLAAVGLDLRPDAVVLLYVNNDNARDLAWGPRPPQGAVTRAWEWLTDHSRAAELATYVYRRRYPRAADPTSLKGVGDMMRARAERSREPHSFEPDDPGWQASRGALEDMASMSRAQGAPLVVFVLNLGGPEMPALLDGLAEFGRRTETPVVDTRPWFGARDVKSLLNSSLHPTAEGHAILAEGMARTLVELGAVGR
jgi:lysophospholipase L1-like esterase